MARWWEYDVGPQLSVKPHESAGEGDFRFPVSVLCGVTAAILLPAAFIAGFLRAYDVALWALGGGIACVVLLCLLPPKSRKESHSSSER